MTENADPIDWRLLVFGSALACASLLYGAALILFRTLWRFR